MHQILLFVVCLSAGGVQKERIAREVVSTFVESRILFLLLFCSLLKK